MTNTDKNISVQKTLEPAAMDNGCSVVGKNSLLAKLENTNKKLLLMSSIYWKDELLYLKLCHRRGRHANRIKREMPPHYWQVLEQECHQYLQNKGDPHEVRTACIWTPPKCMQSVHINKCTIVINSNHRVLLFKLQKHHNSSSKYCACTHNVHALHNICKSSCCQSITFMNQYYRF